MGVRLLLLSVVLMSHYIESEQACPEGWIDSEGDYCYMKTLSQYNFDDTQSFCTQNGGTLAEPRNEQEDGYVFGAADGSGVWLGAIDSDTPETFRWLSDSQSLVYTNWNQGEPNHGGGADCLMMIIAGFWNDVDCGVNLYGVCQTSKTSSDAGDDAGQAVETTTLSTNDLLFNCLRFDQDCENGASCVDGACQCSGNNVGDACQYENKTGCSLTCNDGACVEEPNTSSEVCDCSSIYKGADCSEERIDIECVGNDVKISVDLSGLTGSNFTGLVYLGNNNSHTNCMLTNNGIDSGVFVDQLFAITDTAMCDGWMDTVTGGYWYGKQLTIQFSSSYIDVNDVTLNFTCFHSSDDTVVVSNKAVISVVDDGGALKEADEAIKAAYAPVTFKIENEDGTDLSEVNYEMNVGDSVWLKFELTDADIYSTLGTDRCVVTDEDAGKSLTIIENLCPTDAAAKIFGDRGVLRQESLSWEIKVFRLTESTTTLTVTCDINLCKDQNDTMCDHDICGLSKRRRRRAADVENFEVQKSSAQIKIAAAEVSIITSEGQDEECETPESTKISLISLAVVCVILLVVSLTLVYFLIRNRHEPTRSLPQMSDIAIARFGFPENSISKNGVSNKAYE